MSDLKQILGISSLIAKGRKALELRQKLDEHFASDSRKTEMQMKMLQEYPELARLNKITPREIELKKQELAQKQEGSSDLTELAKISTQLEILEIAAVWQEVAQIKKMCENLPKAKKEEYEKQIREKEFDIKQKSDALTGVIISQNMGDVKNAVEENQKKMEQTIQMVEYIMGVFQIPEEKIEELTIEQMAELIRVVSDLNSFRS